MPYWLMKSEPAEFSIQDLEKLQSGRWDGVRNYQARNYLRSMCVGDLFLFYHSSCAEPGVAGIGRITRAAYPDPTAIDPYSPYYDARASVEKNPWNAVDISFVATFPTVIGLKQLKSNPQLSQLPLVHKGSRLSVMPVTDVEWSAVIAMR